MRDYRPLVQKQMPSLLGTYSELTAHLLKLRGQVARVFGPEFDTASHVAKHALHREQFVANLPEPDWASEFDQQAWQVTNEVRQTVVKLADKLF